MEYPLYQEIARTFDAYLRCTSNDANNQQSQWATKWHDRIEYLIHQYLPHGSGIDDKVTFDFEKSTSNKLIFYIPYHNMNSDGYYTGWNTYRLIIRPSLAFGFDLSLFGPDNTGTKDYLAESFQYALSQPESYYSIEKTA